jgi:NAD(P)-dependent dehydrogenase (short-subunit alcohol dehydrogenase family)
MSVKAVVTGGAMGIGEAIADTVVSRAGSVAILDIRRPNHSDGRFHVPCDVRDEESVIAAVTSATERLGGLDHAYLNAGIGGLAPLLQMSAADWDEIHAVNLRGVFLTLRECAKVMVEQGGGSIVATGSVSGFLVDRCMAHYNSSKAGVASLCRIAAAELGPQGVRVNVVAPGLTDSPLFATTDNLRGYRKAMTARTPLGRIGSCAEVARAAVELAEMEWVNGNVLVADGGVSLHSPIDVADFLPRS